MLKDSFGRIHNYLRISLTDKCNLRCTYCNPVDLPKGYFNNPNKMTLEEIDKIAGVFVQLGVQKIRLTGGEPLVRKDAKEIIACLSRYPVELAVTTNGVYVHEFIETFKAASVSTINVSLDSLKRKRNFLISSRDEWDRIIRNINLLLENNFKVKLNVVVMKGINDDELTDFIEWTKETPLQVRFIEFMPFSENKWNKEKVFSQKEMLEQLSSVYEFIKMPDEINGTARRFAVRDYKGSFAIISSMSQPFCNSCNRMRLTTDGKMKNCLFSRNETDLLGALRKGQDIKPLIQKCIWEKEEKLGGQFASLYHNLDAATITNRSMIHIGG